MRFIGASVHPSACLVTELCAGGSVQAYLRRADVAPTRAQLLQFAAQTTAAVAHLHANNVVHRDIATRNLLLSDANATTVKLADFGLARTLLAHTNSTRSHAGPLAWMSPESITERLYSVQTDVYQLAVTMWELGHRAAAPYGERNPVEAVRDVVRKGLRPAIAANNPLPDDYWTLVKQAWADKPHERPTIAQIQQQLKGM